MVGYPPSSEETVMQIHTQEHIDLMRMFEREHTGHRYDKEPKNLWPQGVIYQDGQLNELFLAYRKGYALARAVYLNGCPEAYRPAAA
jgi:hypothetical protein